MNPKFKHSCFVALFSLMTTALFAQQDFSATMVNTEKGKASAPAKMFVTKGKMRFEGQGERGRSGTMIMNFATRTTTILMPEQKMYMEMASGTGPAAQRTGAFFHPSDAENACGDWQRLATKPGGTCRKVGNETVNGRNTVKYESTSAEGEVRHVWIDPQLTFPIKWEGKNGGGELQNIQEGTQPAGLFEIPSDFQKFDMGGMTMPSMPPNH